MAGRQLPPAREQALVAAIRDVFRTKGWDGASLSDLAAATGLSRASLYHHFPAGKADMAAAALADVEQRLVEEILAPLRQRHEPPATRVRTMCTRLDAYYRGGEVGCLLGAFAWNAPAHGLGDRVGALFASWVGALEGVALDAGVPAAQAHARAMAAVSAIQGGLVLSAAMAVPGPFAVALEHIRDMFQPDAVAPERLEGSAEPDQR